MSVPANVSGEKLVRDYLARLTEAGMRYLPKGTRIAFVGQVRARIERECGLSGFSDQFRVMEVLDELGAPEDLVRHERARIDAAWVKRRASDPAAGEAAAAAVTVPLQPRAVTSRWKPATNRQQFPPAEERKPDGPHAGPGPAGSGPAGSDPAGTGPGSPSPPSDPWAPLTSVPPDGAAPDGAAPVGRRRRRLDAAELRALALAAGRAARQRPLEGAAVALLGVGGFFLPFPFWLLGGFAAVMSKFFDVRDKWVALAGPLAFAVLGTVVIAVVMGGGGGPVVLYLHALYVDIGYFLRAGSLLAGGYLAWRMHQGPRERLPPWKRP